MMATDNFGARLQAIMRRRHPEYTFVVEIRQDNRDVATVRGDEAGAVADHPDAIRTQESAALLDLIGWSTRDEADRLRAVRDAS